MRHTPSRRTVRGSTARPNSTGWPTAGVVLAGTELTITGSKLRYDGTDYSQADTTFTSMTSGFPVS